MTVGELFGLHTLNQILTASGVRSGRWWKVCKKLTFRQIERMMNELLSGVLREALRDLGRKSDSSWSRAEPTVVVDDSVFKQWLKEAGPGDYFAKFFSGQTKCGVYGFRVTLCGMSINGTFYPASLCLTSKGQDTKQVACDLVGRLHTLLVEVAAQTGVHFPNLYLSVDNGFEGPELLERCELLSQALPIIPIFVPKRNASMTINGMKMKVSEIMGAGFEEQEKEYLEGCKKEGSAPEPFALRRRAWCAKLQTEVVLLLFRLNGSRKISAVYTTDLDIKTKTLRRRWFQRTQIEQFFRIIKDTLKIQQAKNTNKEGFERKLYIFVFKALQCQLFRDYCRRAFRSMKRWGFVRIRQQIIFDSIEQDWFYSLILDND